MTNASPARKSKSLSARTKAKNRKRRAKARHARQLEVAREYLKWPKPRLLDKEDLDVESILTYANVFKATTDDGKEQEELHDRAECPYQKWLAEGSPDITLIDPSTPPPRNRREARASKYWPLYYAAECLEVETLAQMGTGVPSNRSRARAKGCKVLKGRWAYDHKKGPDGKILFVKARYTVMGCFQTAGVDYGESYAPVMNMKTLRTVLQIVNLDPEHIIEGWDVKGAYLYAYLDEEVFCDQPIGHETDHTAGACWLLKKSLYGLVQSGRNWALLLRKLFGKSNVKPTPIVGNLHPSWGTPLNPTGKQRSNAGGLQGIQGQGRESMANHSGPR